jgi:hypothetical protein
VARGSPSSWSFQDAAFLLLQEVAEHFAEKSPLRSTGKEAGFPDIDKRGPVMSADILALERETAGLLGKVFGGAQ